MANSPPKCNARTHTPKWFGWLWLVTLAAQVGFAAAAEEYVLGGGDTVQIMVYEQPDLSIVARLSQDDATIAYPLLGEVPLGELTPAQAGRKIAGLLRDRGFLKAPQVTVTVKDYLSKQIPVMGQVNNPGEYALRDESRVVDLIAQAGGLKGDAADVIVVVKNEGGKPVRHSIDMMRFYAGDMDQNIKIAQGDLILVPKMDTFFIHGEVKRPGMYRLEQEMTVMQALSVGGGLNDRGSMKGLKVTRILPDGGTEKIDIQLTDQLKPNDVLYVKERLF
jgi:polysaccharide export outer membrane protein